MDKKVDKSWERAFSLSASWLCSVTWRAASHPCHLDSIVVKKQTLELLALPYLSCFSMAIIKHHDQKQLREEEVYLVYTSQSPSTMKKVRAEIQGRNLDGGRKSVFCFLRILLTGYFLMACLGYGLSNPGSDVVGDGCCYCPPRSGLSHINHQ